MLSADDLTVVVESGREMDEVLGEGKWPLEKHGPKITMEKTEMMWAGQQRNKK